MHTLPFFPNPFGLKLTTQDAVTTSWFTVTPVLRYAPGWWLTQVLCCHLASACGDYLEDRSKDYGLVKNGGEMTRSASKTSGRYRWCRGPMQTYVRCHISTWL